MSEDLGNNDGFFKSILDSITEHIVVIDNQGRILFVNKSWEIFGQDNGCVINNDWLHQNYLENCDRAARQGDESAQEAAKGIRSVIEERVSFFNHEYPCHSPQKERWFTMRVTPFNLATSLFYVITHHDITDRKLAEQEVLRLSGVDTVTGLENRRSFDQKLHNEWQLAMRERRPLSLAMVDIDHFKLVNDTYGHPIGDECLKRVGQTLREFTNRPGDSCARIGGEEFALVWSNTPERQATELADRLRQKIASLRIPNEMSSTEPWLTVSVGVATVIPTMEMDKEHFINQADRSLYRAKENGRNRIELG
ncbi:diguanylate cyclase [Marinobacter lipolyticus SM19]|uniref:diguanylate cyclase n=1 Tax=Marinobacter lipolyticus SM19 TaxID=1318628 RepID=R8B527_9GAMM|nr:sensor domain-containing diguanylate cyclase [Marinobacter lipolyticus]EON93604.1 diguanylate cyclase [Marinobacter lipolyticus SM19]